MMLRISGIATKNVIYMDKEHRGMRKYTILLSFIFTKTLTNATIIPYTKPHHKPNEPRDATIMTDTIFSLTEQNTPTTHLTRNQRRAVTAFGVFVAITIVATLILTIQLNDTVATLSTTLFNHILHK